MCIQLPCLTGVFAPLGLLSLFGRITRSAICITFTRRFAAARTVCKLRQRRGTKVKSRCIKPGVTRVTQIKSHYTRCAKTRKRQVHDVFYQNNWCITVKVKPDRVFTEKELRGEREGKRERERETTDVCIKFLSNFTGHVARTGRTIREFLLRSVVRIFAGNICVRDFVIFVAHILIY